MKQWQFNVLFAVVVVGILVMLFSSKLGLNIPNEAFTIFGLIVSFVLTQRDSKKDHKNGKGKDHD